MKLAIRAGGSRWFHLRSVGGTIGATLVHAAEPGCGMPELIESSSGPTKKATGFH